MKQEVRIKNVIDYLKWVKTPLYEEVDNKEGRLVSFLRSEVYYRGQASDKWELIPGIFRGENCIDEHKILKKAELQLWSEMQSLGSYLEKLVFLQHYGLKTRLLDVTFNPLVALYMACSEEPEENGVVYRGFKTDEQNVRIANLTAKYIFENEINDIPVNLEEFAKPASVQTEDFMQPIFINPPINNVRIESQNGAFIMSPLVEKKYSDGTIIKNNGPLKGSFFDEKRAEIPNRYKESILKELSVLGINRGTLFRNIEEKVKSIMEEEEYKRARIDTSAF